MAVLLLLASSANAATFTVTKTADTNDGTCDADCSLHEAILAANGSAGPHTIAFDIPVTDPGFSGGVAVITLLGALPPVIQNDVTIDGTTQTANRGDTNPVILRAGGNVGVDATPLSQVDGPEVEIRTSLVIANGLRLQGNNARVEGLAILGFGAANGEAAIRIDAGVAGTRVVGNVLGGSATSFTDPGAAFRNYAGVDSVGGTNGFITNNLIGFGRRGVFINTGSSGWQISGNEIRDNDLDSTDGDGVAVADSSTIAVFDNLITGSSSQALVVTNSNAVSLTNNTVTGNGVGTSTSIAQSAAITARSTASDVRITRNIIHANYGAGLQVNNGAAQIYASQNSFADNGTITSRDSSPATGQIGIDLNAPGDDSDLGTSPFVTINDNTDADTGGNGLLNFPILETATISDGNLTLTGWSQAGATIELYIADSAASQFGEGETFVGTFVEGTADAESGSSTYGPGLINGLSQGTDTTERFSFTVPVPAGVVDGTQLTATSTLGAIPAATTSEFSGQVTALAASDVGGRVFEDITGNLLAGAEAIGDANNPTVDGVNVWLYDDGTGATANVPDAGDVLVAGPVATAGGGIFNFADVPNGTYWVVVDSQGMGPNSRWAEQTYGPNGAWCADGAGGTAEAVAAGACFGGRRADQSDDQTNWYDDAEHLARIQVATGDVSNVDVGFSFNVVTTTRGGDGNPDPGANGTQTVQGSLPQFIDNANDIPGANVMRFVPAEPTNEIIVSPENWWRIDLTADLPIVSSEDTTIDGTAYQLSNGTVVRNDNDADQGAGETVGVSGSYTTPVLDPELEIDVTGLTNGLRIDASNTVVRGISIWGSNDFDIVVGDDVGGVVTGVVIEQNTVGTPPHQFDGSFPPTGNDLISLESEARNGTVQNNLIGFSDGGGVTIDSLATDWLIFQNEIRGGGRAAGWGALQDAIGDGAPGIEIRGNLLADMAGGAVDAFGQTGGFTIDQNTIRNNGTAAPEEFGIRLMGTTGSTVSGNIFEQNNGPAILIVSDRAVPAYPASEQNQITQNRFGDLTAGGDNIGIAIDILDAGSPDPEHDAGDGVTPNDGATDANDGNNGLDFPIIDSATLGGSGLTVTGFARPGVTIEFYEAFGAANDNNPSGNPHGEGGAYLFTAIEGTADADGTTGGYPDTGAGADPSANRFSFTVAAPAGLAIGDEISAIAYLAADGTSEFGPNFEVTPEVYPVSGTVFEDIAGNVLAGAEAIGDGSNPVVSGVDVYLYADDGATSGTPDATDSVQNGGAPVASDGSGVFTFPNVGDGTYWVVVDSRTVSPSAGIDGSYLATTPWAEQTYGPDNGWCADGLGGQAERTGAGPCYGGVDGATDDDASALTTAEHIARVVVSGGAVSGVDFGFSYNVVTNVEAAGTAGLIASTYQGSLDQFIRNANAIVGANAMRFVPAVPTNGAGAGGTWWRIDYTGSVAGDTLTETHDADTTIDGTAFDLADGVATRNTNSGFIGANAGGGLAVGVDSIPMPQVARPELEVMRSDSAIGVAFNFYSNGTTGQIPNNFTVRDLATWGFISGVSMTGIPTLRPTGVVIERNVFGSAPTTFADPGVAGTLRGVSLLSTDSATVGDNLIGFVDANGITASDVTGTIITGNEIREAAQVDNISDGINHGGSSSTGTISANLIVDTGGVGIDGTASGTLIENNTITGSGILGVQTGGIRQTGSGNTVRRNVVTGSAGPGVIVPDTVNTIAISENTFGSNGSLAIDVVEAGGASATGDGVTPNDGALDVNDGNDGLDYPIIDGALLSGGNLTVTGFARPGVTMEFYEAVGAADDLNPSGNPHGEGVAYLFTAIEGTADADATTGSYPDTGAGTDPSANRFSFTVAAPAGLIAGDEISATAYLAANGTSEFGPNFTVTVPNLTISGTVFEDIVGDALNDGVINDANNPGVGDVTVRLYLDTGDGIPNAADTLVTSTTTDATPGPTLGTYSFTSLVDGTYFVIVDSQTMDAPTAGLHLASYNTGVWAEQTYGGIGSYCADGAGGTTVTAAAETCYGGRRGDISDDNTDAGTAEHVVRIALSADTTDVDFGLSYNVFVNTSVATAGSSNTTRSEQGSLDQAIRNASNIVGANALRFVPAVASNASGGGGNWWSIDYDNLGVSEEPHRIEDIDTVVDGTAFDLSDGVTARDDNPGFLGTNAAGGVGVGVSDFALPQVAKPELEIIGRLQLRSFSASRSPENAIIRDLAIWGSVSNALIDIAHSAALPAPNILIENLVAGSRPDAFADAGGASSRAIWTRAPVEDGTIRNSLIGFQGSTPALVQVDPGWVIEYNEFAGSQTGVYTSEGNLSVRRNLFNGVSGNVLGGPSPQPWEENTITNATGGGLTLISDGHTVRRNIFENGASFGIGVSHDQGPPTPAHDNLISDNVFTNNGSIAIDLFDAGAGEDQVTPNDGTTTAGSGNQALDYPVIDGAILDGGNLTVTGFARAGVTIEFYEAVGTANDENAANNPHGEGTALLFTAQEGVADGDGTVGASYADPGYGTDASVNRFSFTVAAPPGLVVGEEISPLAYLATFGTSEFGPNFTVAAPTTVSGTIFVDEAGDGLADGPIGVGPNAFESGARIELYRAGADGNPDGGDDTYIGFTTSSAVDGTYSFTGLTPGVYYITVDSQGVDDGPYNGTYTAADTWAEQTYGPAGAASFDGATWSFAPAAGAFYGGARWDVSDDHVPANSLPTGEHIARVDTTGGDVSNVDFGFSFNVVTSTRGGSAAQDPGAGGGQRTVQGSLRQFITNANAQAGANAMRFVPAAPTNATLAGNNWWRVSLTAVLPDLDDAATTIDGAAYSSADGISVVNSNSAAIGSGAAVGVSGAFTTPLLDPELEIQGDGVVAVALDANQTADSIEIRNLGITAFPTIGISLIGILPDALDAVVIENNVIGTSPASFTDNPAFNVGSGIAARDLSNSTIRDNLVGWVGRGFQISFNTVDTLIETNEVREADTWGVYLNGVASTGQHAERITLQGNLIEGNGFEGLNGQQAIGDIVINQNTIRSNSVGVRLYGADNTVTGNIISNNTGDGLQVNGDVSPSIPAASNNLVSQNQFGNNGGQAIDLAENGTSGDGVTINDDGDPDVGANELLNFPIIESAQIEGANLVINGFALPGTIIEFYIADADPSGFGEGVTYLFTETEGLGGDGDGTAGTYGPAPINGVSQGTDTTNRFRFSVATPPGVVVGTALTATGTVGSATSEFSGRATVSNDADLVITKVLDPLTPGPFAEGDAVTYVLTVTNNGPAQATNVTAEDSYPSELTLGVPAPSAPTSYDTGTGVWDIGTLNSGASATLSLPGTVNAGTAGDVVTNSVTVASGDQADPTTAGDDLTETFTVLPFLSIDDIAQVETGPVPGTTTFTFTASINQAVGSDVTFDIDTADGTATVADSDYVAISGGSGTILAGATTTTIDVTVNGDDIIEADETFVVNLSNVSGAVIADGQGQGTINNDDTASVSVAATTNANETGPVSGRFTVTQSTTSDTDTVVSYSVAGTATAGDVDYTTLSGSVTILAGATTATIDVTGIVVDSLVEGTETVEVNLTGTGTPGITVAASPNDVASIDLFDADSATVSIAGTTDANESGPTNGRFTVTQTTASATDTIVSYSVAGTATAGDVDYTTLSGSVTILAGATTANIDVTGIVTDSLVEGTETVEVTLTGTGTPGITIATSPNDVASIDLLDANSATVSIVATANANEAGPVSGRFTVTQSTASATDTIVSYSVAGTATAGDVDYTSLSGSVTILAGATTANIDVTGIVVDSLVEGTETVEVTLTGTGTPGITVAPSPNDVATVDIQDADTANVSISATTNANEAGPVNGQFTVTQSTTSATDTIISYTVGGTATDGGTDYISLTGSVTVLAGATTATIDVTGIVADSVVEGTETIEVTLTGTSNPAIAVAVSPNDIATINLLDADSATVSVAGTVNANEAGPVNGQFTVTQSTTSATDTIVSYTVGGSATAGDVDYTTLSGSVTILAGATTASIDVTGIVADSLVEGTETVEVTLTGTGTPGITIAASPNDVASIDLLDADSATVSIATTADANEAGPVNGQFTVTQSTTSATDTVVSYSVAGTATAGGVDYTTLGGSVTILAGATTATIDVAGIVADSLVEGTETVDVTLTGTSNPGISIAAGPNDVATVDIQDADSASVSIAATTDANEAGPVSGRLTVTQSTISATDTVVNYSVAGTATAGDVDYTTLSGSVTILAGATTANIDVTGIVADSLVEGTETIEITLTGTSNPAIAVAVSPNDVATINLLDADSATVSVAGTVNANEAGPVNGQFTVTQSTTSATDTVVSYTVAGTATDGGTDYTSLTGSVTILAGATTATIDVTGIVADSLVEGTETVEVMLTGTGTPGITVAASPNDVASINLLDADSATVSVAATTNADEAGPVDGQLTVTQSAISATDTIISYTVGGTATAGGTDYATLSGSVTIPSGATTATIDVTGIVADSLIEGTETIVVTVTGTSNPAITVAAGPNNAASIDLLDADAATVSITATTDGNEAGPVNGQFTVTQSATSTTDTVVSYSVAGTATAGGTDYTSLSGTVTIPAGATSAPIDVTGIVADSLIEGTETVEVTVTGTDNPAVSAAASPNDVASIDILDGDSATVTVAGTGDANETGPVNGQLTVTQSATSTTDTVIAYTVGGTATAGVDYATLSGSVTILAGATAATIDVTGIVADALVEGDETIEVTLTGTSNTSIAVAASPADSASISLLDADSAAISIAATSDGNEAGPTDGVFTISQSTASANDTVVNYTVGGSATPGDDYTTLSGSLTIAAGSASASLVVPVLDDAIYEGINETVVVTLTGIASSDPGITIDAAANDATIDIVDNDSAQVSIAATTNGDENGPVDGAFTVTQSAVATNDTTIAYTVGGTATSGSDFTALSGSVTIAGGTTTATITVPVIDDTVAEGADETVIVTLTGITASDPSISVAASPDDSATITIADNESDLVTTKVVDNPTPREGDTIVYTLTVSNSAGVPATNVSLTDMLPAGISYVSDDSGGAYDSATGVWSIGALDDVAPNNVATLNITATVDAGASSLAQPITNTTTAAAGDQPDPDTSSDSLSASVTVDNNADLVTTKIVDNPAPVETSTIVYTLSVTNNGAARATNVSLVDSLPAGVTYVSDDSGGDYSAASGVWTIGTLDNGATTTLNITASVDVGASALPQPITNVTTAATGDQPDPDTTTDDLSAEITINTNADLTTSKTVDNPTPLVGDTIVYTVTVTNNGPAPATNISLTESLPTGVSYISDDAAGNFDPATGTWTVGDLANGATATLSISANVDDGASLLPQPITNSVSAAAGDQPDPDLLPDDLSEDIFVTLLDPDLLRLTKTVGRKRASTGEIIAYSIEIRNTQASPVGPIDVSDTPARGFKYVPGSAELNGVAMPDPVMGLPFTFTVDTLPGFVDNNGNGVADPGEPGYAVISYRMVAGSGVAPGIWANSATATIGCDTCIASNTTSASIEIAEDALFDLGTIIGKVFYDADQDGWQDSGEQGIAAAMVALDDGSYVLTDEFGRYHFPGVRPGQRLLKINLASIAGRVEATNDKTQIVNVTPGLMAKANFGVVIDFVDASIGNDGQLGIAVTSDTAQPPLLINGSSQMPSLLVNGEPVMLALADVQLGTRKLENAVELSDGKLTAAIRFRTDVASNADVERWALSVLDSQDEIVRRWDGVGSPPTVIEWDGIRDNGKLISGGRNYAYVLALETSDGQSVSSGRRLFGVNRLNSVSLNLAGGAFVSGSHELTGKAKALLSDTAKAIRAYPDEIVVISGHTDSVGSAESNMKLAENRARSAFDYLHDVEGLPESQFVIQAFGETQPIATNDTAWGRELNRRVEISGDITSIERARNYDPYRQRALVSIDGADLDVDDRGNFRTKVSLDDDQGTMKVRVGTTAGRSVEMLVQVPTIEVIEPRGRILIPVDDTRETGVNGTVLETVLRARTEPGNTVTFNGEALDVDANGQFTTPVTVRPGDNFFGIVARNPMGMLRIANLKLGLDASDILSPEFAADPIPQLALQLPPRGVPMKNANLVVPGKTVPGNRVFINDREVELNAEGSFVATVPLELGDNPFVARVVDPDGHSGEIEESFVYNGNPMFFMALVDGKFSQLETSGNLQAAGKTDAKETLSEGRIAYYLKGHVLGKYLLTSAFDSGQQELGEIFSDLTAQDNDRLLTNLDPDTLYPVYGDSSELVYDAQSQSKFYLALESETVNFLIGNYALNFTDTELAGYQRTLYGVSMTYASAAKNDAGESKTRAQAFHATIEQAHVRDEIRATGGSLYYLSQRDVIEGSEHISIIVRDQESGLTLSRSPLIQGIDYTIDYVDGRILTNRPISSFGADRSLIENNLLGASAVYLQIDYESAVDGFEQTASGARVRQGVGERFAVGLTAINEEQLASEYSLQAADAELKVGGNSRLVAEFATSEGNNSVVNVSDDGGLNYQSVAQAADNAGDAYKIAAEIDAGEWFGVEDRFLVKTYFKRLDTGFSASSSNSERGSEKSGLSASWKISDGSSLLARYEQQTQLQDGSESSYGTLQWSVVRKIWGVAAEIEDRTGGAGDATMAAVRMNYRWTNALNTVLEHQQTLSGMENNQSAVGVSLQATDNITLDAKATTGTLGETAQLGAQLNWRGKRFYVAQQLSDLEASGLSNNRLVGVETPFGPDGAIYSEYRWSELPLGPQRAAMVGARQRFNATEGLQIEVSGEHSAEDASSGNAGDRYALSVGARYMNKSGLSLSTRTEYRKDSRSISSEQFLSTSNLKWALGDDFAMLGKYRFSKSESSAQVDRNIDFTEASLGLAYRPVEHDRLNLLTRYTRLTNTPTEFQSSSTISGMTSDIFAVDWSYQVSQRIEWVGKQAVRWSESDDDASMPASTTSLSIQRLNWSLTKDFLLGTEYRLMRQDLANDQRNGFVTELMWGGLDPLRLGVGYNFSDVSDNEYADYNFKTTGLFLRVQGKF